MTFSRLEIKPSKSENSKLNSRLSSLQNILKALENRNLSSEVVGFINQNIEAINTFSGSDKEMIKTINSRVKSILKKLEKTSKIVTKGYYRNLYMAIGIGAFGVPFGIAFSAALDNYAFIGLGMPIGMSMGIAIGAQMDEKAKKEGRQLDMEVAH